MVPDPIVLHLFHDQPAAERLQGRLAGSITLEPVSSIEELREHLATPERPDTDGRRFLLLGPGLAGDEILGALLLAADAPLEWIPLLATGGEGDDEAAGDVVLRSVSMGWPEPVERLLAQADPGSGGTTPPRPILELRDSLRRVARIRHDVNNPLTAAMAETQLLLMDHEDGGEVAEALEVLLEQLRRIRDEIGALALLRAPRSDRWSVGDTATEP